MIQATYEFRPPNQVIKKAICETHGRTSADFVGVAEVDGRPAWQFTCKSTPTHDRHPFYARPAAGLPTDRGMVDAFIQREQQKLINKRDGVGARKRRTLN